MLRVLFVAALTLLAGAAMAAEIGRVQLDGREIVINDDNTWAYAETATAPTSPSAPCAADDVARSGVVPLSVCVEHALWEAGERSGAQEFVFYSKDGKVGFAVVSENIVVSEQQFRQAILQVASSAAGLQPGDIRVVTEQKVPAGGRTWDSMRYQLTMQGTPLEYHNFRLSAPGFGAVQIVFWSLPGDAAHAAGIAQKIMASVAIGG